MFSARKKTIRTFCVLLVSVLLILFLFFFKTISVLVPLQENFNIVEWKNLLLGRLDRGTLTYLKIHPKDVQMEDCDEKCGSTECMVMRERQRNLDSCRTCHQDFKKCFRPMVSGGNCEDCLEGESQIRCVDTRYFGSTNPKDIYSYEGVDPYFMVRTTFSQDAGMSQECVFGHQPENLFG